MKYIKLFEEHDRMQRLNQLGMASELDAAKHEFRQVMLDQKTPLDVDDEEINSMSSMISYDSSYDYSYDLATGYSELFAEREFGGLSYTEQIKKLGQTWVFDEAGDADAEELENRAERQIEHNWYSVFVEPSLVITENCEVRVLGVFNARSGPDEDFNSLTDRTGYPIETLGFSEKWLADFYRALTDYLKNHKNNETH